MGLLSLFKRKTVAVSLAQTEPLNGISSFSSLPNMEGFTHIVERQENVNGLKIEYGRRVKNDGSHNG